MREDEVCNHQVGISKLPQAANQLQQTLQLSMLDDRRQSPNPSALVQVALKNVREVEHLEITFYLCLYECKEALKTTVRCLYS